jgi:hypothetical protein
MYSAMVQQLTDIVYTNIENHNMYIHVYTFAEMYIHVYTLYVHGM